MQSPPHIDGGVKAWQQRMYANAHTCIKTRVQNIKRGEETEGAENCNLQHPMEFVFLHTSLTPGRCLECI